MSTNPTTQPLSERELQVLRLIALGRTNKAIAQELDIATNTVNNHVENILRKLGVANRTEAAGWAVRNGYADPADAPPECDAQ